MFVNLTQHVIRIIKGSDVLEIQPSGTVARVTSKEVVVGSFEGVPVVRTDFMDIVGLPEPREGVLLLTSAIVAGRAGRADVVSPDTGPSALRKDGQVWAVVNVRIGGV
jgi:hypothetical protein